MTTDTNPDGECSCGQCNCSIDSDAALSKAEQFLASMRGRLIIAKALHYGIQELEKVKGAYKEISDIEDMQYLKDNLFNFPEWALIPWSVG